MENPQLAMAGAGGSYLLTGTAALSKPFRNAIPNTGCVIEVLTDNKGNTLADYNFGTTEIAVGIPITCKGDYFTGVKLTSGTLMLYLQ